MKKSLKSIRFKRVREPRWCDNCRFEEDHGMHGFNRVCVHPVAGDVVQSENRFHTVCRFHVFKK